MENFKFVVELAAGFGASLTVEAKDEQEAIKIACKKVKENPEDYINEVEIDSINYVEKE